MDTSMKRLTLTQKIAAIIALSWVVGAGASIFLILQLRSTSQDYNRIFTVEVQHQTGVRLMQLTFKKQVQEWKDVLLRGSSAEALQQYKGQFLQREQEVWAQGAELKRGASPELAARLEEFLSAHQAMGAKYRGALNVFTAGHGRKPGAADQMVKGLDRAPTDLLDGAVDLQVKRVSRMMIDQAASVTTEIWWISAVLLVSLLLTGWLAVFAVRRIDGTFQLTVQELLQGTEQIASAAGQVASASQSLAQSSSEQAASIEETSASSQQVAAATRQNAENTKASAEQITRVEERVAEANEKLREMESSMQQIDESSQKIRRIIKIIDEIAFQTNLLALNAAVEAARAGESGMGFAVVADEVRTLAARSAEAAKDTASLIEESIGRTGEGKGKLERLASTIHSITTSAQKVRDLIHEISTVSGEQAQGVQQVSAALTQMTSVTQQAAASSEQSAAAAQELSAQAEAMRHSVGRLG
jgi:hypothetical protein